jgi:ATPase family associated with various cellular activities (AAA)
MGKTEIIRRIAESVSGTFMPLSVKDLGGDYIGQTSPLVREICRKTRGYGRCIIIWSSAYAGSHPELAVDGAAGPAVPRRSKHMQQRAT